MKSSEKDIASAIETLKNSQKKWSQKTPQERSEILEVLAQRFLSARESLAKLSAQEMRKPLTQGLAEIEKSARALKEIPKLWNPMRERAVPEAFGLVFSIQPWNFPFWQVLRMGATAWATGNVVLLKHSELVPQTTLEIEKLCQFEGLSLLKNVFLEPSQIHTLIEKEKAIRMVTFTGSTRVGKLIAETCGRSLKPGVFELGGNDAYFIHVDADIVLAAKKCATSRLINSGQSCVSAKRFFVHKSIREQFLEEFKTQLVKSQFGDPLSPTTQLGPLATSSFQDKLQAQISLAQSQGAKWIELKKANGSFPSVGILDFGNQWRMFEEEEIFGPVALVYDYDDLSRVVAAVNEGPYGLAGGIFCHSKATAMTVGQTLEVGTFTWNDYSQSDPLCAFGGVKDSGFGREMGIEGLDHFVTWKVMRGF